MQAEQFFELLWQDYISRTPSAAKVQQVLGQGKDIINDHVAFRTFNIAPVGLEALSEHSEKMGYFANGDYHFEQKKLRAKHFEHSNPNLPKIFISELLVEEFSAELQDFVKSIVAQINPEAVKKADFLFSGAHWQLDFSRYENLLQESEYAAWLSTFGFCANHFTVNVNELHDYSTLEHVNQQLKDAGFTLNTSGGEIKGSPEVFLEQSSTMADEVEVSFSDRVAKVPSCFYEFARRYNTPEGRLYTGFVEASADKIFESTNKNS